MKFNVVCISVAIGLLSHSIQAAPIVNNVETMTKDAMGAQGVQAPIADAEKLASKMAGDLNASPLTRRQGTDDLLGGLLGGGEGDGALGDLGGVIGGEVKKRDLGEIFGSDGLPIVGDLFDADGNLLDSIPVAGEIFGSDGLPIVGGLFDADGKLLGGLVQKRDLPLDLDDLLDLKKRDLPLDLDDLLDLKKRELAGGAGASGLTSGLQVGQTLGEVEKLATGVIPVDTSKVTNLTGSKRDTKSTDSNDDDKATTDDKAATDASDVDAPKDKDAKKSDKDAKKSDKDAKKSDDTSADTQDVTEDN